MGTTQYVVMLSQRPEYNNKVRIPFSYIFLLTTNKNLISDLTYISLI